MQARSLFVACLGIGSLFSVGCGEGTEGEATAQATVPAVKSRRGESCASRNDCVDELSCVNNTCIQNDYPVDPTAKECVDIECAADADCCVGFVPDFDCPDYQAQCNAGDPFYCDLAADLCVCSDKCQQEQCVSQGQTCTQDIDCGGFFCVTGQCVECRSNAECGGLQCVNNSCTAGCVKDEECPIFNSCESGKCVESGCTSDRECILFTRRPDATCDDKVCSVKCESNAECGELQVCEDKKCLFIGCETNDECQTFLADIQGGVFGTAVCRDAQ